MKKSLFVLALCALTLSAVNAQLKFKENKFDESKINIRALEEAPLIQKPRRSPLS